jgi:putative CocE/NonD family hydrolase
MYGFSYQGMTQLFAAAARPAALRAIAPAMAAWHVGEDFSREGGAFRLQSGLGWGCQLALETARRMGDAKLHQAIYAASRAVPLTAEIPARPGIAEVIGGHGHYLDWLLSDAEAEYWEQVSPCFAGAIEVPALHIGGWYDPLLAGTLRTYHALSRGLAPQHLIVGPWVHIPWSRHVGARDFGAAAANTIDEMQVAWFDYWLRDGDDPAFPSVRLFELGGEWRDFAGWPSAGQWWGLTGRGRAAMTEDDGGFGEGAAVVERFVFDPWRPTPSVGGHAGHPAGPFDRRQVDARTDVLTFTSPPLAAPLKLAGDVAVRLGITSDATSFDVHAVLSEVCDAGVFELTSGHRRVDAVREGPVEVSMRAVCAEIPVGSCVRLSVAAGAFPAFAVNSGTGKPVSEERLIDQRIITLALSLGTGSGSALRLPVA